MVNRNWGNFQFSTLPIFQNSLFQYSTIPLFQLQSEAELSSILSFIVYRYKATLLFNKAHYKPFC
jgi:hypothetical protein